MINSSNQSFVSRFTSPLGLALMFLFSVILVLVITPLFQKGSFIDAMLYKTVAFNYAIGEGSFWTMKYTNTSMTYFCEQPPLYLYLLGSFYGLFGSHFMVDRVFTFLQLLVFLYYLYRISRKLFSPALPFFLLNLFLLLSIQAICWSFANQVIETLVLMLVAIATDLFLGYLIEKKPVQVVGFVLVVFALFLVKGFQSCFIILLPLVYALQNRKDKPVLWFALVSSFFLLTLIFLILVFYQPSKNWFLCYYKARLILTMNDVGATTDTHMTIVWQAFMETMVIWLLFLVLSLYAILKRKFAPKLVFLSPLKDKLGISLLMVCIGGTLPFAVSLVQRGFYLVPAYLSLTLFLTYVYKSQWLVFIAWLESLANRKWIKTAVSIVFIASIVYSLMLVGGYKREKALAHDLELITPLLRNESLVGINSNVWNYFNLHSCLYIQKRISLSADPGLSGFVIVYKHEEPQYANSGLVKINLPTQELDLYYRKGN